MLDQLIVEILARAEGGEVASRRIVECFEEESARQGISPLLAASVMRHEDGRVGRWSRNTDGSYDMGPMQVNTIHLDELMKLTGMSPQEIKGRLVNDGCANISTGMWLLRRAINKSGSVWRGVAVYHSGTPGKGERYAWRVYRTMGAITARTDQAGITSMTITGNQLAIMPASRSQGLLASNTTNK